MSRKNKLRLTRQHDTMDCGPACVRMVASAFGKIYPLGYLRERACMTREGVSVAGIRRALEEVKIESATFAMTLDQLEQRCPLPAVLHWNQNHFVVLERVGRNRRNQRRWHLADPAFGRRTIDDAGMHDHWLQGEKGIVVAAQPEEGFDRQQPPAERHSFTEFARRNVWPYRKSLLKSGLVMLSGILFSFALPFLTQAMVDRGIQAENASLVIMILCAQLLLVAGSFTMQFLGSRISLYLSTHISITMLTAYLTKLLRLPMRFFDTKTPGDYQQRIADHSRLQNFLTADSLQTIFSLLSAPFYLAIMGMYNWVILVAYIVLTAAATLWSAWFLHKRKALDHERFQLSAKAQNQLYEITSGIVDIKVNSSGAYKTGQWRQLQEKQYDMAQRILRLDNWQNIGFSAISQTRNLSILCWAALMVIEGNMTLGMMMSVSVIIGMAGAPLGQLVGFMRQLQDARISLERSDEVNQAQEEDAAQMENVDSERPLDIELRGVTFAYGGEIEKPALIDISMRIPAGKVTAIVGESGSGKTTLMKLLLKFYEPQQGEIQLGGKPLQCYSAESLRSNCGVVMQDNFVFSDTLERNIAMSDNIDSQRIKNALSIACLEDFVANRPLGLRTMTGAEGNGLSGGERQRIMLARVAYRRPPYIFLDEATSSLDAETERKVTENFGRDFDGCTRIVIAHRLSTVRNADNIIVLRHGKIVEQGTHETLIKTGSYYPTLVRNQLELPE